MTGNRKENRGTMEGIEVSEHRGEGYLPLVRFGSWRVAIVNYGEPFDRAVYRYYERHLLTDEVFVLLEGEAELVAGRGAESVPLETGKLYNVRQGVWHALLLSRDAKVLIVEERETSRENTEYDYFR